MLDFEENKRNLQNMQSKLKELGESLWHFKIRKRIRKIRRRNQ